MSEKRGKEESAWSEALTLFAGRKNAAKTSPMYGHHLDLRLSGSSQKGHHLKNGMSI